MHFPSSAGRSSTEPAPVVLSISRAHRICVYTRHLSTQPPGELSFLQHRRFTSRCQSVLRTCQATAPGALWLKKEHPGSAGASPSRGQPDCHVSLRETCRTTPLCHRTPSPEPPHPLGGRGSRRAAPLPQPNSVTSVASVVKKEHPGSAGASPSRGQRDCRVSLRETCRLTPPVPPPDFPRTAPPPWRARLPPSHPAAAAQLCDLCALCGSKKNTAAQLELRPPEVVFRCTKAQAVRDVRFAERNATMGRGRKGGGSLPFPDGAGKLLPARVDCFTNKTYHDCTSHERLRHQVTARSAQRFPG